MDSSQKSNERPPTMSDEEWEQELAVRIAQEDERQREHRRLARTQDLVPSTVPAMLPPPTGPLPPTPTVLQPKSGESSRRPAALKVNRPKWSGKPEVAVNKSTSVPKGGKRNSGFARKLALFEQAQLAVTDSEGRPISFMGREGESGTLTPGQLRTQREQISAPYLQTRISEWEASARARSFDTTPSSASSKRTPARSPVREDERKDYFDSPSTSKGNRPRSVSQPLPLFTRPSDTDVKTQRMSKTDLDLDRSPYYNPYAHFKFEESPEGSEHMAFYEEEDTDEEEEKEAEEEENKDVEEEEEEDEEEDLEVFAIAETVRVFSQRPSTFYSTAGGSSDDGDEFEYDNLLSIKQLTEIPESPIAALADLEAGVPAAVQSPADASSGILSPATDLQSSNALSQAEISKQGEFPFPPNLTVEKNIRPDLKHNHTFGSTNYTSASPPYQQEGLNLSRSSGLSQINPGSSQDAGERISMGDMARDLRSLSRISGINQVSGGVAFLVSESSSGSVRNSIRSMTGFRMDELAPPLPTLPKIGTQLSKSYDGQLDDSEVARRQVEAEHHRISMLDKGIGKYVHHSPQNSREITDIQNNNAFLRSSLDSGKERVGASLQKTGTRALVPAPNVKVHPADERYEHVWRVRNDSTTEEPYLVPMYNYPKSGGQFPDRNYLTSPNTNLGFINHTPRGYETPYAGNNVLQASFHATSDSSSELLPKMIDGQNMNIEESSPSSSSSALREKYTKSGTFALMNAEKGKEGKPVMTFYDADESANSDTSLGSRLRQLSFPFDRKSIIPGGIARAGAVPMEHEKAYDIEAQLQESARRMTIDTPEGPGSDEVSIIAEQDYRQQLPTLHHAHAGGRHGYYGGYNIDKQQFPDQFHRQKRIGQSLLVVCTLMPPMWLLIAGGQLDVVVNELTQGDVWGIAKTEKTIALVLGASFCVTMVVVVIVVFAGLL